MKVRRKSLWRSANNKHAKFRANQRAAKERKRLERVARDDPMPDMSHVFTPRQIRSGFRITIECLDDGERVRFTTLRGPFGLTISSTEAGRRVSSVLKNYKPSLQSLSIIRK